MYVCMNCLNISLVQNRAGSGVAEAKEEPGTERPGVAEPASNGLIGAEEFR